METAQHHRQPLASQAEHRTRVRGPRAKAAAAAQLDFLTRLTQDAHDLTTPIGAFLAALPRPPKRHAKSSSERGRAFRERQQRREGELEEHVETLHREIVALDLQRKARETRSLNRRTGLSGSLVQTIQEYHRLFTHGLMECPEVPSHAGMKRAMVDERLVQRIKVQEEFIRQVFHTTAIVGNTVGPEASIVQWRRYTQSHATMTAFVTSVEVLVSHDVDGDSGIDDDIVTVVAHCALRVRLSRETFKMMFPHVLSNEAFVQRLVGKEVTYDSVKRFQFSSEGRIVTESVDVDFVGGLMKAGCSLADIATLMGGAAITSDSMIVEVEEDSVAVGATHDGEWVSEGDVGAGDFPSPLTSVSNEYETQSQDDVADSYPAISPHGPVTEPSNSERLSMAFLLSDECDSSTSVDSNDSRAARYS
jgi:hypothetical protein